MGISSGYFRFMAYNVGGATTSERSLGSAKASVTLFHQLYRVYTMLIFFIIDKHFCKMLFTDQFWG